MKIIKKGKIPIRQITCKNCESVLEYNQADVKCEDRPCADPYVICPVCERPINLMRRNNG